jgi:transposase
VARKGKASVSQIARNVGISEFCLQRWLNMADRDGGLGPPRRARGGGGKGKSAELRRRNKLREQKHEILRRATASFVRDVLPE